MSNFIMAQQYIIDDYSGPENEETGFKISVASYKLPQFK